MKKYAISLLCIGLASCSSAPSMQSVIAKTAQHCPKTTFSIVAPDFYQNHTQEEIDGFYGCMQTALRQTPSAEENNNTIMILRFLAYQHILCGKS